MNLRVPGASVLQACLAMFVIALIPGCGSTVPPTAVPVGSSVSASPAPSPTAGPTVTPTIPISPAPAAAGAQLEVSGDGKLECNSPGGCGAALLLQPAEVGPLPTFLDYEAPSQFTIDRPMFEHATLLGPVSGAPDHLQVGRWRIGLGYSYSSDAATCDSPCASYYFQSGTVLLCSSEFVVREDTTRVTVRAHFSPACSIEIQMTTTIID